jgi:type II secretory pathway pseudopilin PulG
LIEILVVVLIIGIMIAGLVLSIGSTGRDSELERERDRLNGVLVYVRERAELQTLEYGLLATPSSYRFVVYDSARSVWQDDALDNTLASHRLPAGLGIGLSIEGRDIVLKEPKPETGLKDAAPDLTPQVMLFSSGDTSDFELRLSRSSVGRSVTLSNGADGNIAVSDLVVKTP